MKTKEEILKLELNWLCDPCWDIEDTEGFEEHRDELKKFRLEREVEWKQRKIKREEEIDKKADELGIRGVYRLVLAITEKIDEFEEKIYDLEN